jgi:hypothetical protein
LDLNGHADPTELAYEAILNTAPLREQVYSAFRTILKSDDSKRMDRVHTFFEEVSKSWDYTPPNRGYSRWDNDALRYFIHDCFVGFVALCIGENALPELADFLSTPFYRPDHDGRTGKTKAYIEFRPYIESFEHRNKIKSLNRISLHADVISETHEHSIVPLDRFLEADLILYVRGLLAPKYNWYPVSAIWLSRTYGTVRLFARAESTRYYDRIKTLFFSKTADELRTELVPYVSGQQNVVRFDYETLPLARLLNLEQLATSA